MGFDALSFFGAGVPAAVEGYVGTKMGLQEQESRQGYQDWYQGYLEKQFEEQERYNQQMMQMYSNALGISPQGQQIVPGQVPANVPPAQGLTDRPAAPEPPRGYRLHPEGR